MSEKKKVGRPKGLPHTGGRTKDNPKFNSNAKTVILSINIGKEDVLLLGDGTKEDGKKQGTKYLRQQMRLLIASIKLEK